KAYGTNDPSVNATTPTFTGRVNASVTDWNGTSTAINDSAAGALTLSSLTRTAGENVGSYSVLSGTAGGTAIGNYTATVNPNAHVLSVTPAALTGSIANQTKTYGVDDPTLSGITVTLGGVVNGTVTNWNGTSTPLNDTGNVSATLATLARGAGELVSGSPYTITSGKIGRASCRERVKITASVGTAGKKLTITPAALTVNLTTDASKAYGTNDPSV